MNADKMLDHQKSDQLVCFRVEHTKAG